MDQISTAQQAAIDAAEAPIAVLDEAGVVIAVNRAWIAFGRENGREEGETDIGTAYPFPSVPTLRGFLEGEMQSISLLYPCHSPTELRFFRFVAFRIRRSRPHRILVLHRRLTDAPNAADLDQAAAEMTLRWEGVNTICAWCESKVRAPLGGWVDGRPEPGRTYSHGICDACAEALLPTDAT